MAQTIGIMSMQRIYNYGSTLQAYSLRRLIEGVNPDARVSFVDYRPGEVLGHYSSGPQSRLRRIVGKVREYSAVDAPARDRYRFLNHKRTYGKRYLPILGITPAANYNFRLDCQVIGSDEVFNCVQDNSNVGFSRDLFGHATPAKMLISYAASFGNTTLAKIRAAGIEDSIRSDLAAFDALSVRDRNSRGIVRELIDRDPDVHVDPALAYELMSDSQVPTRRLEKRPYVIVYGYSGRLTEEENRAIRAYAKRAGGARILSFGGVQECADEFIDCNPFELLAYFRDAAGVVTDTFHGTIFSIINNRPFVTIVRPSAVGSYGNEEKLNYLLDSFDLSSRRLVSSSDLMDVLDTPIDGRAIALKLVAERSRTRDYLERNVLQMDKESS